eukprot:10697410-Lingulodinium_polyedra.AAC.1
MLLPHGSPLVVHRSLSCCARGIYSPERDNIRWTSCRKIVTRNVRETCKSIAKITDGNERQQSCT